MNRSSRKGKRVAAAVLFSMALGSMPALADTPRNLVLMIGDGMGPAQVKAYRLYADDPATEIIEPLPMDSLLVGAVATDSIVLDCPPDQPDQCVRDPFGITDSASSATAYATGRDTVVERLSMDLEGQSMPTLLEAARRHGKTTGLVVTSEITHATPAAFASHVMHRDHHDEIADQFFDSQWSGLPMSEVMMGGGLEHLQRPDRDLVAQFREAGYQVALDRQQLLAMDGDRLLGLFAAEGLPRAWDRAETVPSLAEMTRVALDTLNRNPQGFFLLVEGSQVDWAAHRNSVPGVISEMADFVSAIRVVLDFARDRADTLVVITADHETGGMSLGRDDIYHWNPGPLHGVRHTPKKMTADFLASDRPLSTFVAANVAFELTEVEKWELDAVDREEDPARQAISALFNRRTLTGWTTGGHTGLDAPLYVHGPGRERFGGVMLNEVLGRTLWDVFLPGAD
jgi:alkaline phosphatase